MKPDKSPERQREIDTAFINVACDMSPLSRAKRNKVGAVLVNHNHRIISTGINGTPTGFDNVCEVDDVTLPWVLHAEMNALAELMTSANHVDPDRGATMYQTLSPCIECAKLMLRAGVRRVVYLHEYRQTDGIDLLRKANVTVERYEPDEHPAE